MVVIRGSLKEWERLKLPNMIGRFENTDVSPDFTGGGGFIGGPFNPPSGPIPSFGAPAIPRGVSPVAEAMEAPPTELQPMTVLPERRNPSPPLLSPTVGTDNAQFNPQLLQLMELLKRAYGGGGMSRGIRGISPTIGGRF